MPARFSTSNSSEWVTMPAPRPDSSAPTRSKTSACQPARRSSSAAKRPAMEPPTMMALGCLRVSIPGRVVTGECSSGSSTWCVLRLGPPPVVGGRTDPAHSGGGRTASASTLPKTTHDPRRNVYRSINKQCAQPTDRVNNYLSGDKFSRPDAPGRRLPGGSGLRPPPACRAETPARGAPDRRRDRPGRACRR